jgi:membrane protein
MNRLKAAFAALRQKRPLVDHLVRMYGRYQADTGDRLAAAVTFYWFLSLFPILLIAVYVTSLALGSDAGRQVTDGLRPYLGDATAGAVGKVVQNSAGKAGLIGLAGTLLSGLGWIQALREAIRSMWHHSVTAGNLLTRKGADAVALVGLFAVIAGSVVLSGAATAATTSVLDVLGLSNTTGATFFTIAVSYALGAIVDVFIFLYLFRRLAKVKASVREVFTGAVFGAIGFEVLKAFGAFYIGRTTSKGEATYGTFAVVVGLLLFLNLVSRLVLYAAAFVVTAPYDSDVRPSGTADGAPTALGAELTGHNEAMEKSWAARSVAVPAPVVEVPAGTDELPGAARVQQAARLTTVVGGALLAAVAVYAARTLQGLLRR